MPIYTYKRRAIKRGGVCIARNRQLLAKRFNTRDANPWKGPFFFMQLADPQLGGDARNILKDRSKGWKSEEDMLSIAVDKINELNPHFAIVCGDMVEDATAPNPKYDQQIRAGQLEGFKRQCKRINPAVPLVCICGNHDVGDRPNSINIARYAKDFGDDYFCFWVGGIKAICINAQLWPRANNLDLDREAKMLCRKQEEWLKKELESDDTKRARHVIVFSHIAPFNDNENEPDSSFNIAKSGREWMMPLFEKHGVRSIFCGHAHRNGGAFSKTKRIEVIVSGAIGFTLKETSNGITALSPSEKNSGLRIVYVDEDKIQHRWYTLDRLRRLGRLDPTVCGFC